MKRTLLAAALTILASGAAFAAERPMNWSGFYMGVTAGLAWNNDTTNYDYAYVPGNASNNFSDFFGSAVDNVNGFTVAGPFNVPGLNAAQSAIAQGIIPASLGSSNRTSFAGGGQVGFNWQSGTFVYGAEADLSWLGSSASSSFTGALPGNLYVNTGTATSAVDWLGTARLRGGYAFDRALVYVTGGVAFGGVSASSSSVGTDGNTTDTFIGSTSGARAGFALGAGFEYAFSDHWSGRVEGLYYNLGTAQYALVPQDVNTASEGLSPTAKHTFDGTIARAALNYHY